MNRVPAQLDHVKNECLEKDRQEQGTSYHPIKRHSERWLFVKISPEQFRFVTQEIRKRRNVATILTIWNTALSYLEFNTGEIIATRDQLSKDTNIPPCHVSTAMTELVKIHAVRRERRGSRVVYFINPNVGWNGHEAARQNAATETSKIRLITDNTKPLTP